MNDPVDEPQVTVVEAERTPYASEPAMRELVHRLTQALASDALIDAQIGRMATSWKEQVNLGPHLLTLLIRQQFVLTVIYNPDPESQVLNRLLIVPCRDPTLFAFYVAINDLRSSLRRVLVNMATGKRWRETINSGASGGVLGVSGEKDIHVRAFQSIELDMDGTYVSRQFLAQALFSEQFKTVCLEAWKTAASVTFLMERLFLAITDPVVMFRTALAWLQQSTTRNVPHILDHILRTRFEFTFDSRGSIGLLRECPMLCITDESLSKAGQECFMEIRLTGPAMFQCNTVSNKYNCNVAYKNFKFPRMFEGVMSQWRVGMLRNVCNTLMLVAYSDGHRSVMIMFLYRQVMCIMCRLCLDTIALKNHLQAQEIARNNELYRRLCVFAEMLQDSARRPTSELDAAVQQMCVAIGVRTSAPSMDSGGDPSERHDVN